MSRDSYIPFNGKKLRMLFPIETYDYIPILSVLIDEYMQSYLCLCSEIRGKMRWIVSLTKLDVVQKLVNLEISVNQALKEVQDKAFVIEYSEGNYSYGTCSFDEINPLYLTEDNTYAEFQDEDVDENLKKWERLLNVSHNYYTGRVDTNSSANQSQERYDRYHVNDSNDYKQKNSLDEHNHYRNYSSSSTGKGYADNTLVFAA